MGLEDISWAGELASEADEEELDSRSSVSPSKSLAPLSTRSPFPKRPFGISLSRGTHSSMSWPFL